MSIDIPFSTSGRPAVEVAAEAARGAGQILTERFRGPREIAYKGRGNIVTDADRAAELSVVSAISREYPTHNLMTEESDATEQGSEFTWVVDPLDGTTNYALGFPVFSVAVALARDSRPVVGAVYDPLRDEMFLAERGKGTTLNGVPLAVGAAGAKDDLTLATVGFDMGYQAASRERALQVALAMVGQVASYRLFGSAVIGLSYVAAGRLDLYCHYWLYPWDLAAASLVAEEAGAKVVDWSGNPVTIFSRGVVCGNPELVDAFISEVAQRAPGPEES